MEMVFTKVRKYFKHKMQRNSSKVIESCIIDSLQSIILYEKEPRNIYTHKCRARTYFNGAKLITASTSDLSAKQMEYHLKQIEYLHFILMARLTNERKSALAESYIRIF